MDDAYYTALPGSQAHRAAYAKEFEADHGIGFPNADVDECYYADNYEEIEREVYYDWLEEQREDYYEWLEEQQASRREAARSREEITAEPEVEREREAELPW